MTTLWIDFETRSRCDLRSRGVYNYAQDPSTEVLCMSYAFDDEDVVTWTPTEPFPTRVALHIGQIRAHNAAFERLIFWYVICPDFGIPEPKLEQFYCTATQARANCAPGSLEDVGRFAGASMKKDHRGAALVRALSIPQGDGVFREDPKLMLEMIQYCEQDVRSMRAVSKAMRELADEELDDYYVNERVNDRGVMLDVPLAKAAVKYAAQELDDIQDVVREVTGGALTSVRSPRMREWVQERVGPEARKLMQVWKDGVEKTSIDKTVRANLLAMENPDEVPPEVAEVVQCADDLWASSVAKFSRAAALSDDQDGRVRGAFVFCGGSATGRASSYGLQVHNFPRRCADEPELVRQAMVRGHQIVPQYGRRVTDVLKGMLRPALIPAPGKSFVVADWSSIEARVTPWCSGAGDDKLTLFRDGADVYKVNAAATFRCRVEDVTKDQRQVGKVQELACIAEDTLVLTDNGWKVIQEVTQLDALWDGEEWVLHQGVIPRGVKPTVNVAGIAATPDHLFLAANEWTEARLLASSEPLLCRALATGSENLPSSVFKSVPLAGYEAQLCNARVVPPLTSPLFTTLEMALLRAAIRVRKKLRGIGSRVISDTRPSVQMTRIGGDFLIVCPPAKTGVTIQTTEDTQTTAGAVYAYTNRGTPTKRRFLLTSCRWMDGINRVWNWTASTLTKAMNPATCGSSQNATTATTNAASSKCSGTSSNLRRVYDIAHVGPRNRFTVLSAQGPLITHNCGFAGGVGAFAAMGRVYGLSLPESEARKMVDAWRRANPWSVPYWQELEIAYTRAIRNPKTKMKAGRVTYYFDGLHLWYALPSGRVLCYPFARIEDEGVTYAKASWKPAADAKEWPRARLWKGLACENITQATAADILRSALRQLPDVVLHVHDEIVVETDQPEAALAEMQRVMATPPAWAEGLPLGAEASVMARYGK